MASAKGQYHRYGGYEDTKGRRWRHRRPNGWPNDDKAPDGFVVKGFRKVDNKNRLRFGGCYWTHPDFLPGMIVNVEVNDPYGAAVNGVIIDEKWTPDTIADDYWAFLEHAGAFHRGLRLENVGDWNKRRPR